MKKKAGLSSLSLAISAIALVSVGAQADDFYCAETLGMDYEYENIIVPYGAHCKLEGTKVKGNVMVKHGGALWTYEAMIDGNIEAYGPEYMKINASYVDGNIDITKTTDVPEAGFPNEICESKVGGNIELYENYAPYDVGCEDGNHVYGNIKIEKNYIAKDFGTPYAINVAYNKVKGNIQFNDNMSDYGEFNIYKNYINGNLECYGNYPYPIGGGNTVYGNAEGQCYDLVDMY